MQILIQRWLGPIALLALAVIQFNCALTRELGTVHESLILLDGTEVPVRIVEITEDEIRFEAISAEDAFRFGDRMLISQIEWIKLYDGYRTTLLTVDEYLRLNADQFEEVVEEPRKPVGKTPESPLPTHSSQKAAAPETGSTPEPPAADELSGPGLRFRSELLDSLYWQRRRSGIGLGLPELPSARARIPEADYADLADFIVASGAAGLVLYRAEKFAEKGIRLSTPRQLLVDAIRGSTMWKNRKQGLKAAHRIAAEAFRENFDRYQRDIRATLGFRARQGSDAFIQFVIYLRTHGSLMSRKQREHVRRWFGEEAEQALIDLLANFDDWYYIAVVAGRSLQL